MLNIAYELNLTQDDYDLLRQNKKQHSIQRTWLKDEVKYQRDKVKKLEKQVKKLELKLNEDRQNQEIAQLRNQVKQLKSRLKNMTIEYTEINGPMVPVYSY